MRRLFSAVRAPLLTLAMVLAVAPLAAQSSASTSSLVEGPPRPKLDKRADPNSWESYFDLGVEAMNAHRPNAAGDAFWWSMQLAPDRAEPIFGRWVAFWMSDYGRWERHLNGDERVHRRPEVMAADSLPRLALERNPFVHQGLAVLLYDQMPGEWRADALTRGWIDYSKGKFEPAVRELGVAVRSRPKAAVWIRTMRAQAFVSLARYDSAAAELHALDAELSAREAHARLGEYESKEILHYALGILAAARGQNAEARAEMEAALTETLAFAPAHDLLAHLALARGDTATAVGESEQAAQLAPDDPVLQYRYGAVLLRARRPADAVAPLRRAIALRPWYAAPLYDLGDALDRTGDLAGAREVLARFVAIAPRADSLRVAAARMYGK